MTVGLLLALPLLYWASLGPLTYLMFSDAPGQSLWRRSYTYGFPSRWVAARWSWYDEVTTAYKNWFFMKAIL